MINFSMPLSQIQIQINQLKAEKFEMKNHISKLEEEVRMLKGLVSHFLNVGHAQTVNASQQQTYATANANANNNQTMPSNVIADRNVLRPNATSNRVSVSPSDSQKQRQHANFPLKYGTINSEGGDAADQMHVLQQQFNELLKDDHFNLNRCNANANANNNNAMAQQQQQQQQYPNDIDVYVDGGTENHDCTIVQMENENLELRRELQDARASNKQADKKIQE